MTRVALLTMVLNETEWLERLHEQHKDWPGLVRWVFVEAADRCYAQANPEMVNEDGLSVDDTTEFLHFLSFRDERVSHVRHGFSGDPKQPAQGKCEAKTRGLRELEQVRPDVVIVLDADECYTREHQRLMSELLGEMAGNAFIFKRREVWRPPSLVDEPLFSQEIVGGFWDIPCCHWWRWHAGMEFKSNHNTPEIRGFTLGKQFTRLDRDPAMPQMVHLGFSASLKTRAAKNRYYEARGEDVDPKRSWYVESRRVFETWWPGEPLPASVSVIPYQGPIPEAYQEEQQS